MIIVKGDLLTTPVKYIAHQVNCQGVMGAGVALQLKKKYPALIEMYSTFIQDYKDCNGGVPPLGNYCAYDTKDIMDHTIINIFGQNQYGCSKCYTNYDAVYQAFSYFHSDLIADREACYDAQLPIAIPYKMGCGLAGGDWEVMYRLLLKIEKDFNILFIAYELP